MGEVMFLNSVPKVRGPDTFYLRHFDGVVCY